MPEISCGTARLLHIAMPPSLPFVGRSSWVALARRENAAAKLGCDDKDSRDKSGAWPHSCVTLAYNRWARYSHMREGPQNLERGTEDERRTRTRSVIENMEEIEKGAGIRTGRGIGVTGTGNTTATIGSTVKEVKKGSTMKEVKKGSTVKEVKKGSTVAILMTMIVIAAVNVMLKEETVTEMAIAGIAPVPVLRVVNADPDLVRVLVQRGQLPAVAPLITGMLPNMFNFTAPTQFNPLVMQPQAMTQQATRHARRVYVGGLPPTANEQTVAIYFNQVMAAIGGNTAGPGDAVLNVYINHDKKFAFVEMRSVEEASNAMALDGIMFEGAPVKVRRPTDYNPSLAAALGPSQPNPNLNLGAVGLTPGSAGGLEGPDRIFVGGLPYYFTEAQVRELLESFGPLRGFDLVKDRETGNSKGYAFCVYQDLNVTDIACAALNGIKMGDKTLTVRRANQGTSQPRPEQETILLHAQQQVQMQKLVLQVGGALPTKVVCLTQVVSADELRDDEEYEDILEDMREEGRKYGNLVKAVIPRPDPSGAAVPGVGKVFLEYADIDGSTKAKVGMHGRKFGGNQVVAVFYPENKFADGDYDD
ncbi:Splicing factor U2af large subunit A [Triticum urartu]|uniref:Splicing factor U2af large subunit n=1 Tax=Triticum urartu TaxID=4572 RepID=M7Z031_TRIUA|nr:Splicing factor U2af large subunit A [Triticum urartu]